MGFFDSLLKSASRKAVDGVVDGAVGKIFGNNNQSEPTQQPQQTVQPLEIRRPDLSGTEAVYSCFVSGTGVEEYEMAAGKPEWAYVFEKSPYLVEYSSGALEVDCLFYCADTRDEVYDTDGVGYPYISLQIDDTDQLVAAKRTSSLVRTPVINNPRIFEKVEFDYDYRNSQTGKTEKDHYVVYRYYPLIGNRNEDTIKSFLLVIPSDCSTDLRIKTIKSFELLAATMKIEFRMVP